MLQERITGFQHLGIPTYDIDKFYNWFVEVLGVDLVNKEIISTDVQDEDIIIYFLKKGNLLLELYQLTGEDRKKTKERKAGSIDHFAVDTLDVDQAYDNFLLAKRIQIDDTTSEGPVMLPESGEKGAKYLNILGPNQVKVELNQDLAKCDRHRNANIKDLSHIGIPCPNLKKVLPFYLKLGFQEYSRVLEGEVKIILLEKEDVFLELYTMPSPGQEGIIDHIALQVDDIEKAFAETQELNLTIIEEDIQEMPCWKRGVKFFNILGPDNVKIEMNQKL